MKYQYEYTGLFDPNMTEMFDTKEKFKHYFRNSHNIFEMFIDNDDIDMLHIVVGCESYKLKRVFDSEV